MTDDTNDDTPQNPFEALERNAQRDLGQETFRADATRQRQEVDELVRRMSRPGRHRKAFQFAGEAVVIVEDRSSILRKIKGKTVISRAIPRQANHGLLLGVIEPISTWMKWYRNGQGEDREVPVPDWVTSTITQISGQGLPPLAGVADFPVMVPGGKVLCGRLGYDPDSHLYVDCEPVQHNLHKFDSPQQALDYLVDDWLGEFHFKDRQDAIRSLALPLTVLMRRTMVINGCPIPFITAPTPETGKTALAQCLIEVVTGMQLAATSWDHDNPDERRKMLMALGMENPAAVLFDNIQNGWEIRCAVLERWITSDSLQDRILGKNKTATVPTTSLLIFTGNNIGAGSPDIETRCYIIRMERPAKAKKFARPDILQWTAKNRTKIIAALHCIANAKTTPAWTPISRFPSWAALIGAKLQFAANDKRLFPSWDGETGQHGSEEFENLLEAMATKPGWNEEGFLPGEMSDLFTEHLVEMEPHKTKEWVKSNGMSVAGSKIPPKQIWGLLRKYEGQTAGGYRLRIEDIGKGLHSRRRDRKVKVFKALRLEE